MTTEVKVTEELFQQALKASGSFEIARSNAERVSMRQGFELGMQYARHHQADDVAPKMRYDAQTIEAVQRLLEQGKAYVDSDGYLTLVPHHQSDDATLERVARAMFLDGYKGQDVLKEAAWNPHCAEAVARAKAAIAAAAVSKEKII